MKFEDGVALAAKAGKACIPDCGEDEGEGQMKLGLAGGGAGGADDHAAPGPPLRLPREGRRRRQPPPQPPPQQVQPQVEPASLLPPSR